MNTILLNCILNDIATCNFYFSDHVCTLLLKTIILLVVKCDYHTCQLSRIRQQSDIEETRESLEAIIESVRNKGVSVLSESFC